MTIKAGQTNKVPRGAGFCGRCSSIAAELRHWYSWCFCPWFLSEYFTLPLLLGSLREKGSYNKLCSATSPYFPLSSSLSTYLSISLSLSLCFTHTVIFFVTSGSQPPSLRLSVSPIPPPPSLHPSQSDNGSERCMWCNPNRLQFCVRDAAPLVATAQLPLIHLRPTVSIQTQAAISCVLLRLPASVPFHFLR